MDRLAQRLAAEPFLILDGGLATELEGRGLDLDDPLWSARVLLEPAGVAALTAVHRSFVDAGADVITSASYQATIPALEARGCSADQARALLRESVALAQAAAAPETLVAASIGSYGAYLADGSEYRGDYDLDAARLEDFHRPRLEVLADAGPDLLAFEAIPSAREARAIGRLLERDEGGPRAWVSFSLRPCEDQAGDSVRISDGTPLAEAVAPLRGHPRVAALGVNCLGPGEVQRALELLASVCDLPLIAYPNSGERWRDQAWTGGQTELARFLVLARAWLEAGARIVGGCCRTTPAHTRALAALREQLH